MNAITDVHFRGVWPAAVTPMTVDGEIDGPSCARLAAHFSSCGVTGIVVAGTTGEGPSLAAVERRDLLKFFRAGSDLPLVLGVTTSSLAEACWLANQAQKLGAAGLLVLPPSYFRPVADEQLVGWFRKVAAETALPLLAYNFPQRSGVTISPELLEQLAQIPNVVGVKDSSGDPENIATFAHSMPAANRFVGDERLLPNALQHGWVGTISGAANVLARHLVAYVNEPSDVRFELIRPVLEAARRSSQPACHKQWLYRKGIIESPALRLPLVESTEPDELTRSLAQLGIG